MEKIQNLKQLLNVLFNSNNNSIIINKRLPIIIGGLADNLCGESLGRIVRAPPPLVFQGNAQ